MNPDPDSDPDPAIIVIDLQEAKNNLSFLLFTFEGTFTSFFKEKDQKSQNSRNQGFSYYFCLMIEGAGSRCVPLTNGSGSDPGGPKTYGSGSATLGRRKTIAQARPRVHVELILLIINQRGAA
jgi:hypothetical protein